MYVLTVNKIGLRIDPMRHTVAQAKFAKELEELTFESLANNFRAIVCEMVENGVVKLCADVRRQYAGVFTQLNLDAADLHMHVSERRLDEGRFWLTGGMVRGNPYNLATGRLM